MEGFILFMVAMLVGISGLIWAFIELFYELFINPLD